jgi:hypothetical protein
MVDEAPCMRPTAMDALKVVEPLLDGFVSQDEVLRCELEEQDKKLSEQDEELKCMKQKLSEQDEELKCLKQKLSERDEELEFLKQKLSEREECLRETNTRREEKLALEEHCARLVVADHCRRTIAPGTDGEAHLHRLFLAQQRNHERDRVVWETKLLRLERQLDGLRAPVLARSLPLPDVPWSYRRVPVVPVSVCWGRMEWPGVASFVAQLP